MPVQEDPVEIPKFPPFLPIFISGLALGLTGWLGLAYVISSTDPELGYRWLFFFCVALALSGTSLPVVAFLNRRFPSEPPAGEGVLLRQAVWVGAYASILVWLQQGRLLNGVTAFFLAVGLILVEILLRMGERAVRKEPQHE